MIQVRSLFFFGDACGDSFKQFLHSGSVGVLELLDDRNALRAKARMTALHAVISPLIVAEIVLVGVLSALLAVR